MKRLSDRLEKKGLQKSTQAKYTDILETAGNEDLLSWIQAKARSQMPIGTLLPMRAAVKHYLAAEHGYSLDELESLLPPATGRDARSHQPLDYVQLAQYHAGVERIKDISIRTILTLLPLTGLKISEACELPRAAVDIVNARIRLQSKNGTPRVIALNRQAVAAIRQYSAENMADDLFFGNVTPHMVRKFTRQIAASSPDLASLCPEVLRTTFAVLALKNGMDVVTLQHTMGHESIQNTRRYLEALVANK